MKKEEKSISRRSFLISVMFLIIITSSFNISGMSNILSDSNSFDDYISSLTYPFPSTLNDLNDSTEFETFADTVIMQQLAAYNIVGASISAVKDGKSFFNKGYGYANKDSFQVVTPNSTLFRIGSISKTFTAISVLQLVEDGLLDLDEDINTYLTAFKITETFPEPITLRNLLTHTAGFEEFRVTIISDTFNDVPEVEDLLKDYIPARVYAPGQISAYSNYGLGLAAYIVEEISGKAIETYINDEIATPLGLNYTSFQQPLPSNLDLIMSKGYDDDGNQGYFENVLLPGAGACSSSAGDMARLMLALLNNGTYDGGRILNNETVALMQENHFQPHPSLPGVGLGLYEFDVNDVQIIGHGGDTIFFHSRMALFPEHDFGFFITYNSQKGGIATHEFFNNFIYYYFPKPTITAHTAIIENLKDFNGQYLISRRLYNKYYTATPHIWFEYNLKVTTNSSHLMIPDIPYPFVQISPDFFVAISDFAYDFYIAFIKNEDGEVTHFYSNFFPSIVSYEKMNPIYAFHPMQLVFAIVISIVFVIIVAAWGIDGFFRFRRKEKRRSRSERFYKWWVFGTTVFGVIPFLYFALKSQIIIFLAAGTREALGWLIAFPYISTFQIIGLVVISGINWIEFSSKSKGTPHREKTITEDIKIEKAFESKRRKERPLLENIQFTVLAVFGIFIIVFFSIWRMYGF